MRHTFRQEWEDFDAFDAWVLNSMHDLDELVGLVVFHPCTEA